MRIALVIIVFFLGTIVGELTTMPGFWIGVLCWIAAWRLVADYYELKKWRHLETHEPLSLKKKKK